MPKGRPISLYSIWRNSDDQLLILDGTAEECCKFLGIQKNTFYRYAAVSNEHTTYTIRRIKRTEAEKEARG